MNAYRDLPGYDAALEREGAGEEDPQEELVCAECGYPMDQSDHAPGCGDA